MDADDRSQREFVDLTQFDLEPHVAEALRVAKLLAGDHPVSPSHALQAAMVVGRTRNSTAFSMLASLLPAPQTSKPADEEVEAADPGSLRFDDSLSAAYSDAKPFLEKTDSIWGRDYVTLALLAVDPLPRQTAGEEGGSLHRVRDEWFRFVTSDKSHRDEASWAEWWHQAGVPLPDERQRTPTNRAYLLTWDSALTPFSHLAALAQRTKREGAAVGTWSVGEADVSPGDRVFLMRHDSPPRGLVGSGRIAGDAFWSGHWNKTKSDGTEVRYAPVLWDVLDESPLVSHDELMSETGESDLWTRQGSGLSIEPDLAGRLEALWAEARRLRPRAWLRVDAVPGLSASGSVKDSLDVKEQAVTFATLLIAKDIHPPYAIGLLGDWGVGKTSFMRLMQQKITSIAGKSAKAGPNSGSVSRAAQIEFNAWHYVDSDLWASLASHIFDGLSQELREPDEDVKSVRRELRRRIESSQQERQEAETTMEAAKASRQDAAGELTEIQEKRASTAGEHERCRLARVWKAVLAVKPGPKGSAAENWPDLQDLKNKAETTAKRLGISEAIDSAQEAHPCVI